MPSPKVEIATGPLLQKVREILTSGLRQPNRGYHLLTNKIFREFYKPLSFFVRIYDSWVEPFKCDLSSAPVHRCNAVRIFCDEYLDSFDQIIVETPHTPGEGCTISHHIVGIPTIKGGDGKDEVLSTINMAGFDRVEGMNKVTPRRDHVIAHVRHRAMSSFTFDRDLDI